MFRLPRKTFLAVPAAMAIIGVAGPAGAAGVSQPYLSSLSTVTKVGTTVPANGDVNPYGVAVVPTSTGKLVAGDVLISNFNSKANVQGTGTTIVQVAPDGTHSLFSKITSLPAGDACPGGIGLSTALDILPGGWVVVGSLPTKRGALPKNSPAGCLIVLNKSGAVAETFSNAVINGPWDMTAQSTATSATLFVANALGGNTKTKKGVPVKGNCTVARLDLGLTAAGPPVLNATTLVGTEFPWKADKGALVLAPTGLALSGSTLFVDNTLNNTVSAIPDAATRTSAVTARSTQITKGGSLNAPLGMITALNGDVLIVNGNDGVITEVSPSGQQVAKRTLIKNGAGDLFGLALTPDLRGIYFVDDGTNTLQLVQPAQG